MTRTARSKPVAVVATPAKGFDIASRRMAESIVITLKDPVNPAVELDAHITVLSPRAKPVLQAANRRPLSIKDGKIAMGEDDFEASLMDRVIAATIAWDLTEDGAPLECSEANVRRVYESPELSWIGGQVQRAFLDLARFFPSAPSNS